MNEEGVQRRAPLFFLAIYLTKRICDAYVNMRRDVELVAEPVLIRTFNNPAEMVRICEAAKGQIVPVLRNGVDELYVMDYETYREKTICSIYSADYKLVDLYHTHKSK